MKQNNTDKEMIKMLRSIGLVDHLPAVKRLIELEVASSLQSQREVIRKWAEKHPNTYEGDEALVFRTTMKEVLDFLTTLE